ncbi:MAG TPA: DUF4405 domain-containing protein [Candidatus Blautia faecipullorum]|nr:DUF4405 domain-containing protein [Candidatus Blautia faecipullorum]
MTTKARVKILIDVVMTLLLFAVMAYPMTGEALHKWLGISLFLLFLVHHILNLKWYQSVPKGKYTAVRWIHCFINVMLFISMIGLMVSGFLLSSLAYDLNIHAGLFSRKLHMLSASWGYILMSAHIGLHWGMFLGLMRKRIKRRISHIATYLFCAFSVVYGFHEAATRQFFLKMFWMLDYAFYDFGEPVILFMIDYAFIMIAFACLAYYAIKLPRKSLAKKKGQ